MSVNQSGGLPTVIAFQYNPGTLSRQLQPRYFGADETAHVQSARFAGPPVQQISVEVEVDAADQLEAGDLTAAAFGIHPQLAALEALAYPGLTAVSNSHAMAANGMLEIAATTVPLTLFVWGANRVLPVRVESFRISEQLFDPSLNPIQATVSLELRVLSYADLEPGSTGYNLFVAYQQAIETLGGMANAGASVLGTLAQSL